MRRDKTPRIGTAVDENTQDKRWCRVVGFAAAKMSRLSFFAQRRVLPFRSAAFNALLPRQGEHTRYTVIPQGLWDYLFAATLTEADSLRSYSHGLIT